MKIESLLTTAKDSITVGKVFGEPYERDGVTVIPAARVAGGGGGGTGQDEKGQQGEGGGFGLRARPAGAYVIRNGTVHWRPALDTTVLIVAVATVVVAVVLARAWVLTRPATTI